MSLTPLLPVVNPAHLTTRPTTYALVHVPQMMAVLPVLCDGLRAVFGWIPVFHEGILYVVLAKKITTCLMEASVSASGTNMADVFKNNAATVTVDSDLFKQIMLKTPLKVYKKSAKMSGAKWLKSNLDHYMILKAEWFRGLVAEVERRCDVPDQISIDALEMVMGAKTHMFSDFSVTTHGTPGPNVYENMGDGLELSLEQLQGMPAMKISMWTEAYQSGCMQYFGMKENDDGVLGVVSSGKYNAPHMKSNGKMQKSHSYQETLERIKENKRQSEAVEPDVAGPAPSRRKRKSRGG